MLNKEPASVVTKQLWILFCSIVQSDYGVLLETLEAEKAIENQDSRKKGSPTQTIADRYQSFYSIAEDVLENYKDKTIGAQILGKFYIDDETNKADWHPSLRRFWISLCEKADRELPTWLNSKVAKALFTAKEMRDLNMRCKKMVYVGSKIYDAIHKADTAANTHLNKHWPREFKSGQSPGGKYIAYIVCLNKSNLSKMYMYICQLYRVTSCHQKMVLGRSGHETESR